MTPIFFQHAIKHAHALTLLSGALNKNDQVFQGEIAGGMLLPALDSISESWRGTLQPTPPDRIPLGNVGVTSEKAKAWGLRFHFQGTGEVGINR